MSLKCVVKIGDKDVATVAPIDYVETFSGVNKIPYAKIRVRDWLAADPNEGLLIDESYFKVGGNVSIEFGDDKSTKPVFNGVVIKQGLKMNASEGVCYTEIIAKDKASCLTLANHTLSFKDKTDDEILKAIISDQGLTADVSGLSFKHESFTQYHMTDWDLINIRAEAYGRVVVVDNGKVSVVAPKSSSGSPTFSFGENIISMDLVVDADHQIEDVTGKVWDLKSLASKDVKATAASESSFGSIGYSDVTSATNKQKHNFVLSGINTEEEVKNVMSGILALNRFAKIQGTVLVAGNSDIKPNSCIKLEKGSGVFQGDAYVSGVKHILDEFGWSTKVFIGLSGKRYVQKNNHIFLPDNQGIGPSFSGFTCGTVVKIDEDPESEQRIFVNIPLIHGEGEGAWCRFVSPYASSSFGCMFFPEVDDEVAVSFLDSDPRYPVVVGSFYSSKNAPPEEISGENEVKMIKTKSEMVLKFDEKDKIITILTPGSRSITISDKDKKVEILNDQDKIVLDDGAINIKCSKDITLEGSGITLKAQKNISLQSSGGDVEGKGNNVKFKANMAASLEGNASATVKSSGNTVVKGSLVNIN